MAKLKLGIIGVGGILKHAHMKGWLSSPDVEISAVCDVSVERA
ncbi:hypothetical protein RB620_08845 [Paenibacillus sp. LHD-117]|nr:hypothetical protein [Paenibacillus sp. LHD-117]MDQ6419537.1 hypothetical protein [Paenibacillus sp. LHD-117]